MGGRVHAAALALVVMAVAGAVTAPLSNAMIYHDVESNGVSAWVYVPAVTDGKGKLVNLSITITWPGNGTVHVLAPGLIAPSTLYSITTAIWTALLLRGIDPLATNAVVSIEASGEISGPSASLAASSLAFALLTPTINSSSFRRYVITGAIIPQGFAGPIGGADIKCMAALKENLTFVLPLANYNDLSPKCKSNHAAVPVADILDIEKAVGGVDFSYSPPAPNSYPAVVAATFKNYTNMMLLAANKTISTVKGQLSMQGNISAEVVNEVIAMLTNAEKLLSQASARISETPYSAASLAFTALADSLGAYYTLKLATNASLANIINSIHSNITSLAQHLSDIRLHSLCLEKLELYSVAAARISDAEYNLKQFRELYRIRASTLADLGYSLGLAQARILSIESWLRAAESAPCHTPLPSNIVDAINFIVKFSLINANYTISVLKELGLNAQANLIESIAQRELTAWKENNYILALGYAREILSLSTTALFSGILYIEHLSPEELATYYVAGLRLFNYTTVILNINGVKSILAPMYVEYARVLASLGDYNSSLNVLASAIAANEVLLPLVVKSPPVGVVALSHNITAPAKAESTPLPQKSGGSSQKTLVLIASTAFTLGVSLGVAIAVRAILRDQRYLQG